MQGARPLSLREVSRVLKHCKDIRLQSLVQIGINLGLRVSELVSLRWKDLIHRGHILPLLYLEGKITKGRKPRGIPINSKVAHAIMKMHHLYRKQKVSMGPDNYLFPGYVNGHLSSRHINRLLRRLFDHAGLIGRLSSHTLRKTFGTVLAEKGINLPVIQELLGHADITTTRDYIGVGMGSMQNAVQILDRYL